MTGSALRNFKLKYIILVFSCRRGSIQTANCVAERSLDVIKAKCNNKQSCLIQASNKIFGDPCFGTFKYLELSYNCETLTLIKEQICKDERRTISCETNEFIRVVNGVYGRSNNLT